MNKLILSTFASFFLWYKFKARSTDEGVLKLKEERSVEIPTKLKDYLKIPGQFFYIFISIYIYTYFKFIILW